MDLYDTRGHRLYLTADERRAFLSAAKDAALPVRTFCLVLHYTGCRISEALALTPQRFDFAGRTIVAGKRHRGAAGEKPLWAWSRTTAWRRVKEVLDAAGIVDGPHKSPKGLRHGYGVAAVSTGVPPNMLKKWMGHASLEVTAIYSNAMGEEQHKIAARMWD